MLSISPSEKVEQLITVFSQRLHPLALQRLSVANILQDAAALEILQEEIPSIDDFCVMKRQKQGFVRLLKFLHLHEPTGYEKDEEHKRTAVRYLALRTMLQQCRDIKIPTIQEACLDRILRWFDNTEVLAATSTPILPLRMSPKKPRIPPTNALEKCSSEMTFPPSATVSNTTTAAKLEKYKIPDLRASHIRRVAELRSRGVDISDQMTPLEEDNNLHVRKSQAHDFQAKGEQNELIEATFKLYHPETDAEREMNLLWMRRRQEDETERKKDEEVQQRVQKWAMNRSRDESENLRKQESAKLVARLGQILQEGVNRENPFVWQSTRTLHPDLARLATRLNQSVAVKASLATTTKANEFSQPEEIRASKQQLRGQANAKQPAQIVIKTKRSSVSSGGGMHFRNELPPNYVPPGLSSVPKTKREVVPATRNTRSSSRIGLAGSRTDFKRRTSNISNDSSSASEDAEDSAIDDSMKTEDVGRQRMKLQSYHVSYYCADDANCKAPTKASTLLKHPFPRGTIPVQHVAADPEFRCLQEANAMRRVFAFSPDKRPNSVLVMGRRLSSPHKSAHFDTSVPSKLAKGKRLSTSSSSGGVLLEAASAKTQYTASTSDLRQIQMEELEKIRRLFEEKNLSLSSQALENGLLVPEDRPLLESITNLPFPGSRLLNNPLPRKFTLAKGKKKPNNTKKKPKKSSRTPKRKFK